MCLPKNTSIMIRNIIIFIGLLSFSLMSINSKANQIDFQLNLEEVALSNSNPVLMNTPSKKEIRTDTLHVEGNCNLCKERIENAALIKGVKKVVWDKYKHQLIVIYDTNKTDLDKIQKAIAEAGHDTPKYKANNDVYNGLPKCCAYREPGAYTH